MSQPQKPLTNEDKAKALREARKRLDWSQRQMSDALGLDPSYLSQLENGHRPIDDWYIRKASELQMPGNVSFLGGGYRHIPTAQPTADSCVAYLAEYLSTCEEPAQVAWTLVELREHFPLNKWASARAASSRPPSAAAALAERAGADYDRGRRKS